MIQGWCPSPAPDCLGVSRHSGRPGRLRSTRRAVWSSTAARRRPSARSTSYVLTGSLDVTGGSVLFEAVPSNPVDGESSCPMRTLPRWASTSARWARPGTSSSPGKTSTPLPWTDGSRRGELRREHGDGPRGQRLRSRGPARPGFLRPGRPVHDPDSRTCRHRAAGDHPVRIRGTKDRLRNQPGGAVARPAPTAAGRAPRRGPLGPADRVRPRDAAGPRRSVLGGRHRSGIPPSACAKRDHLGGAAGSSGGSAGATGHAVPQVRRHRIRNSVAHGGELYSATLAAHGYSPLPAFEEPLTSPSSRVLCRAAGRTSCPATGQGAGRASREWVRPEPRRSRG
jgi:hypothetical protein